MIGETTISQERGRNYSSPLFSVITFSTQRNGDTEKKIIQLPTVKSTDIQRFGQFWRICNPPALIIGICNAENYRVLYSLSEFYRIKNPDIKRGRISNPPERANEFSNSTIRDKKTSCPILFWPFCERLGVFS